MKTKTKKYVIVNELAENFLYLDIGEKIPTINELVKRYEVGTGTVQSALKILKDSEGITIENKGFRGSRLTSKNEKILREIIGEVYFLGVMPLPYSKRYEGLATGIYEILNKPYVNLNLAFMSGSDIRLKGLYEKKYDFMVTSKQTAETYVKKNDEIEIYTTLHEGSFIEKHVFLMNKNIESNDLKNNELLKVGIDLNSPDQNKLTMSISEGNDFQLIPIKYTDTLEAIKKGIIDGAVWSGEGVNKDEFKEVKLSRDDNSVNLKQSTAAIIGRKDNKRFKNHFKKNFNVEKLKLIQKEIMDGTKMANY